jgi:small subunit ribosomal protein S16
MAVRLRLQRTGRRNYAQFRVVAADARRPRDGHAIEVLGYCDPHGKSQVSENVKLDRVDYWISVGAEVSHSVKQIVRRVRQRSVQA